MHRKEWTLAVVAAAQGSVVQPVQLQKCLFLISRNLDLSSWEKYEFSAYDYGPFSKEIYADAVTLANEGHLNIRPVGTSREYYATPSGLEEAQRLTSTLPASQKKYLDEVVAWSRGLSFKQLVEAIYQAYPEMRANSVFRS